MKFKTLDLLNIPTEKFESMLKSMSNITAGRGISDEEEIQFLAQSKAMKNALNKTAKSRMVSPEMKPTIQMFEKADYDLTKLPAEVQGQFVDVYQKIQSVVGKNPSKYKNTPAELYCTIYEMFANNSLSKLYKRVKTSSLFNEIEISREALKGIESWEYYAGSRLSQSQEWIFASMTTTLSGMATTVGSVNIMLHTLTTILIFLIAALIVMCIICATFNIRLALIIEKLAYGEKIKKVGPKKAKEESIEEAVAELNDNTSNMTKTFLYKPVASTGKVINELSTKLYGSFDKTLSDLEKNKKSKENLEQSTEFMATTTTTTIVIILCVLPLVLPLLRSALYYISHFRLKMSEFFKEQAEWTEIHIEELIAKRDDPTTSPIEKERITKVIEKQKEWAVKLGKWGENIYKSEDEAGSNARSEIRNDDSKDYEQQARNEKNANKTLTENPEETVPDDYDRLPDPNQKEPPKNNDPKKPIVIF